MSRKNTNKEDMDYRFMAEKNLKLANEVFEYTSRGLPVPPILMHEYAVTGILMGRMNQTLGTRQRQTKIRSRL